VQISSQHQQNWPRITKYLGYARTCQAEDWAMKRSGAKYRMLVLMAISSAMIAGGCNSLNTSGIDPTGEHVLAGPPVVAGPPYPNPYQPPPPSPLPKDPVILILTPSVTSAPVGSEVLLIAGVGSADGYLRCNQRLEWTVPQGSVGQFIDIGKNDFVDILLGDYNRPRLVNSVYGIGSTASKDEQVKRAPPAQAEEIAILPGQGWIKITSPIEGISTVAVTAPKIVNVAERTKTATIYWTDATWRFPPPAINSAGAKHVFTTTVMRQTNQSPSPGWVVKYSITGGPPAGFSPDGASSIEVPTDAAGQASAEIFQKTPAHGTNQIAIEVVRPAELPGAGGQRMTVGTGSTMQTWTAADIGLKLSGPPMAKAGDTLTYRLDVSNPGDLPSKNIVVSNVLPDGLSYLGSNPPAYQGPSGGGRQFQWQFGELGPRQRQIIAVSVRAEKEGSVSNCADVMTAAGLKVSDCATTTITAAAPIAVAQNPAPPSPASPSASSLIDLQVLGPKVAAIGSEAVFNIVITNRNRTNLNNLLVKDHFDPGLEFLDPKDKKTIRSPIEYPLGDLPASKSTKFDLSFHVTQAGNLYHTVEVFSQKERLAIQRACVMVSAQSTPPPGIAPPGGQIPSRAAPGTAQGSAPGTVQGPAPGNKQQPPLDYRQQNAAPTTPSASAAARAPTITIKQTGPSTSQHAVGDVVSFVSKIANPNNRPLTNLKIVYHFDPALLPKFATDHYRVEGGNMVWVLAKLPAGNYTQIEVKYECEKAAVKAGNTVSVSSSEGAQAQDTAYLEIRPGAGGAASGASTPDRTAPVGTALGEGIRGGTTPGQGNSGDTALGKANSGDTTVGRGNPGGTPWSGRAKTEENKTGEDRYGRTAPKTTQPASGPLTLTVAALHNPIAVGKELTYQINVINNTGAADRDVTVAALVPDGMIPVRFGTTGPGSTQYEIDRQAVDFNPVMTLQPGETLSYKVRVLAKSAGQFRFRVRLSSQNTAQPLIQDADTEVFDGQNAKKDE
jgi:uncharacterized repeat protein (TIGR01451 family)